MDPILQTLLSWQFMLFSLAIATVVFVIRTLVEYLFQIFPKERTKNGLWRNLVLPLLPITVGIMGAALITTFPYPNGLITISGRIIFGLVAGAVSGTLYRVLNSILDSKITTMAQSIQNILPQINTTSTTITQTPNVPTTQQVQINNANVIGDQIPPDQLPNRGKR